MEFDTAWKAGLYGQLLMWLMRIDKLDHADPVDYKQRNWYVLDVLRLANQIGIVAGIRIDPEDPAWPVVYMELPTGQVSWHIPQHQVPWDGHTTKEKYERIRRLLAQERERDEEQAE